MSASQIVLLFLASTTTAVFCWEKYHPKDHTILHEGDLDLIPNGRHVIVKRGGWDFGGIVSGAVGQVVESVKNVANKAEEEINKVGDSAVKEVLTPASKAFEDIKNQFKDIPELVNIIQDEEVKKVLTIIIHTFSENGQFLEQLKSFAKVLEEDKNAKAVIHEIITFLTSEDNAAKQMITELINTIPGGAPANAVISTLVNLVADDSKLLELIKDIVEILTKGDEASQVFKKLIEVISTNPAALKLVKDLMSILPAGGQAASVIETLIKTLSKPEMVKVFEQVFNLLSSSDDKGEVIKKLILSADSDLLNNIKTAIGI